MGVLALDHAGIIRLVPTVEHAGAEARSSLAAPLTAPAPEPADRFAYAPLDAVALLSPPTAEESPLVVEPPPVDEPALRGAAEPDITGSWLAEIQPEGAAPSDEPQHSDAPPRSLPWQASAPRSRSAMLTRRLAEISPAASARLASKFDTAEATWAPSEIALVAIKDEKVIELFARPDGGEWKFIHSYPVLAASGVAGPKLRQGDKQVPEGVYGISFLNPESRYHVSLRVNYPNAFDRQMAEAEGRSNLGGDIMIHGKAVSIGCLAVGDAAAEELFVLAAQVGLRNIKLVIAPTDFRRRGLPAIEPGQPKWLPDLYTEVASAMSEFKPPPRMSLLSFFGN
ncbi:MAG: hypothetical protein KJZ80_11490 [Hyphomicrobiaceae bacterium]|nr:hypothetical protein [Hyphomicrobiaceae bacterium]